MVHCVVSYQLTCSTLQIVSSHRLTETNLKLFLVSTFDKQICLSHLEIIL